MTAPHRPDDSLRDPVLDAAWTAHSTELPPPRIDAAILAAAHREAKARPESVGDDDGVTHARRPARAWWGLAAAATLGAIAFSVLQLAPPAFREHDATVTSDVPPAAMPADPRPDGTPSSAAPAAPPVAGFAPPPNERANGARSEPSPAHRPDGPQRKTAKVARAEQGATDSSPPPAASANLGDRPAAADARTQEKPASVAQQSPPAGQPQIAAVTPPAPPPAAPRAFPATPPVVVEQPDGPGAVVPPAEPSKAEGTTALAGRGSPPADRAAAMVAPRPEGEAAPQRKRSADSQPLAKMRATPEAWTERIRTLHEQQRFEEAARELNAFRDAYPDADSRLPASLLSWAAGVKRLAR